MEMWQYIVLVIILIIWFIMFLSYLMLNKKQKLVIDETKLQQQNLQQQQLPQQYVTKELKYNGITSQTYFSLYDIVKNMLEDVQEIKELNHMINYNIAIPPVAVINKNKINITEYNFTDISIKNTKLLKEHKLKELTIYYMYVKDMFKLVSDYLVETSREEFLNQIAYVGNFLDTERNIENEVNVK